MCGRTGLLVFIDHLIKSKSNVLAAISRSLVTFTANLNGCMSTMMVENTPLHTILHLLMSLPLLSLPTPAPVKVTGGWIHDYSVLCYDLPGTRNILHKGDYRNHNLSTNNCRLEGIQGSKLYGPVLQDGGRCVIVVEGFYEWQTTIKTGKIKQPYYIFSPQDERIQVDDPETWNMSYSDENGWNGIKLLHMAGLYSIWQHNEVIMYSYSVITMDSNSTLDWLHHRMPAILDSENQVDAWLNITDVDPHMALGYLRPVKILSWHPVSTLVNNSRNKSSDCNKRISINQKNKSTQKTLTGWFVKAEKRKRDDNSDNKQNKKKQC